MPRRAHSVAKELLEALYGDQGLSIAAVAHHTNTTIDAVRESMRKHEVVARSCSAHRQG
jgi:hypothetical protein